MKIEIRIEGSRAYFVRAQVNGRLIEKRPSSSLGRMSATDIIEERHRSGGGMMDMTKDLAYSKGADLAVKASLFTLAAGAFFASEAPIAKVLTGGAALATGVVTAASAYETFAG